MRMSVAIGLGGLLLASLAFGRAGQAADGKGKGETMVFVVNGIGEAVETIQKEWTQGTGYLASDPKPPRRNRQALYSARSLGSGNFHITARLTIFNLRRSASAFTFGGHSFFGFEGAHGAMFITGPLFNDARGDKIGNPADYLRDGKPFEFECVRKEDVLYVMIDGKTAYTQKASVKSLGPVGFHPARSTMRIHEFSATGNFEPYREPKRRTKVKISDVDNITMHPLVRRLPELREANHVRLGDGGVLTAAGTQAFVSYDEGKTWKAYPIFQPGQNFAFRSTALVCTRSNAAILVFVNERESRFSWDRKKNLPKPDCRRPTYIIRSLDSGKTWIDLQEIDDGYCGCLNDCIQTRGGNVIVAGQELLYKEGRHTTRPYVSKDDGKTWIKADKLDIEMSRGDHQGLIEATLEQLGDGRIWILMRSYHGFFYESHSSDDGLTWSEPVPSKIKSTGSPGLLKRLASGRLFLMWNAIPNEGFKRREELFIAFSEDDGKTWTDPIVILRNPGGRVSYPHVFERVPGELWFSVHQGHFRGVLREDDFLYDEEYGKAKQP